jgi:hypothetical protein
MQYSGRIKQHKMRNLVSNLGIILAILFWKMKR